MKIVGLLAWFDEDPAWLSEAVASARILCDEVVALDGAYAGFPGGRPDSPADQYVAIQDAGGSPVTPLDVWADQMEKRSKLFELGAERGADWFFVFDADDLIVSLPFDTRQALEHTTEDVAVITYGSDRYHRGLFRNLPNLRVEDAHYHYLADKNGGVVHLRGNEQVHELAPFLNLTHMRVRHRKSERDHERAARATEYRLLVAANGIEATTPDDWAAVAA